jgi:hypothetical protein
VIRNIDTPLCQCGKCHFGTSAEIKLDDSIVLDPVEPTGEKEGTVKQVSVLDASKDATETEATAKSEGVAENEATAGDGSARQIRRISCSPSCKHPKVKLPDELFLLIFDLLETEDLLSFAEALPKIADVITEFIVIRTRELRCFCLKKDYTTAKLGVGISVTSEEKGNWGFATSEFDIVSKAAFELGRRFLSVRFGYALFGIENVAST